MNNFKKIFALLLACVTLASFASCGKGDVAVTTVPVTAEGVAVAPMETPDIDRGEEKISIAAPEGVMGFAFYNLSNVRGYAYNVQLDGVTLASAAEKFRKGEADIAVVSFEDAVKLATESDAKILAVSSNLKLSLLENGDTLKDVNSLKGKTIYCGFDDAASKAVIKTIFADNGMSADLVFGSAAEVEAKLKNGEATICIFAEPDATRIASENEGVSKKADMTSVWKKEYAPVKTCIVANAAYVEANPDKISEFYEHIEIGTNYLTSEVGAMETGIQLADNGYFATKEEANATINASGLTFIDGEEMQAAVIGYCDFLADNGVEITAPQF